MCVRLSVCCAVLRVCVCVSRENQVNQNERIIRSAQKQIIRQPVPLTKESEERDGTKRNETERGLLACHKLETNSRRFNAHISNAICALGKSHPQYIYICTHIFSTCAYLTMYVIVFVETIAAAAMRREHKQNCMPHVHLIPRERKRERASTHLLSPYTY